LPAAEISDQHMIVKTTGITDQKASYQLEFLKITLKKYMKIVASI
jgi:RNA 3'-terminal phosphate cyclase